MRRTRQKAKRVVVVTWWYGCCSGHVMSQQVINAAELKAWFRHEHCHDVMLPATITTPQYYYNHSSHLNSTSVSCPLSLASGHTSLTNDSSNSDSDACFCHFQTSFLISAILFVFTDASHLFWIVCRLFPMPLLNFRAGE